MSERWVELLGEILEDEDRAQMVEAAVGEDPAGLIAQLRERTEEEQERGEISALLAALAKADTLSSMEQWFVDRDGGWQPEHRRSGSLGDQAAGVEWTYEGSYTLDRALHGAPAVGQPVEAHGFTIFGVDDGGFTVFRHLDWAGLFAQLGFTLNTRVPLHLEPEPADDGESGG
ncbi:MAG TPA: hypothetical protein VFB77_15460 [Acidimicrobiales bacterium]|nr:hypothetical protein [Acidimicrobiales bacterium]